MEQYEVRVLVTSKSDDRGIKDTEKTLNNIKKQAEDASKSMVDGNKASEASFGSLIKKVGEYAVALFGIGKAISFLKNSFRAAVEEERIFKELEMAMRNIVNATDETISKTKELIETAETLSGIQKEEMIPGYMSLLEVTKDVDKANILLRISVGAAAQGMGTASGNMESLTRAFMTGTVRGTDPFRVSLREMIKDGKISQQELAELAKKYGDMGASVHNAGIELDRQAIQWDRLQESVGGAMKNTLIPLMPLLKGVMVFIEMVAVGVLKLAQAFVWAAEKMFVVASHIPIVKKAAVSALEEIRSAQESLKNSVEGLTNSMAETMLGSTAQASNLKKELKSIGDIKVGSEGEGKGTEKQSDALNKLNEEIKKAIQLELDEAKSEDKILIAFNKYVDLLEEIEKQELKNAKTESERQTIKLEFQNQIVEAQRTASEKIIKIREEQAKFEKEFQESVKDKRLEAMKKEADAILDLVTASTRLQELYNADVSRMSAEPLERYKNELKQELEALKKNSKDKQKIARDTAKVEEAIDKANYYAKVARLNAFVDTYGGVTNQVLGMAANVFGQNKAIAIAQAIIDTYEAATKALAVPPPPVGMAFAAIITALGLANVAKIQSAKPEKSAWGGYDIPSGLNPVVQAHAEEMILPASIANPLREMVNNYNTTTHHSQFDNRKANININTLTGATGIIAAREVAKKLKMGNRMYNLTRL
jgi:hypothetical protein